MVVTTYEQLQAMVAWIAAQPDFTYDIETTGTNVRRDSIIGIGVGAGSVGYYLPLYTLDRNTGGHIETGLGRAGAEELVRAIASKACDTWNGSFEFQMTHNNFGIDINIGTDVMLLVHTCDENLFDYGLKSVAARLWGADTNADEAALLANIKANGGKSGKGSMIYADIEVLAHYCIQDCLKTHRIKHHYLPQLKSDGLWDFFYTDEVMPLYREVTIPMEMHGVRLDVPKLEATLRNLNIDMAAVEAEVQAGIAPYLLDVFTPWFLNKDYPTWTYTGKPSAWTKKHSTQYDAWQADNPGAYMFNLTSPHHKKKLFFDTLKEESLALTPTGQPKCDEEFLDSMAAKYAWCRTWIQYNKLLKLRGTYVERLLNESEDGRFYPSWFQHRTVSGRYAGDLQQLPRPSDADDIVAKYTSIIREFIIADENSTLCSADYEQLEPSIFSHTSGDERLQSIFREGRDFYSAVAIRSEGLDGSDIKTANNYLGKTNKAARQAAKAYALGIAYGETDYKLQFELGITQEEGAKLIAQYFGAFPDLKRWIDKSHDTARRTGQVRHQLDRLRRMPDAKRIWAKHGARILDPLGLWKWYNKEPATYKQVKQDYKVYKKLANNSVNFQVQGLAASIANRACIAVARTLRSSGLNAYICMQVHDQIVVHSPETELQAVKKIVQTEMENIIKLSVPLRAEPIAGKSFQQCK